MNPVNLDNDGSFSAVVNFILGIFHDSLQILDNIMLGNFSLLDLGLGILAMGLIIAITLVTIKNFASGAVGTSIRSDRAEASEKTYQRREAERREYYESKKGIRKM